MARNFWKNENPELLQNGLKEGFFEHKIIAAHPRGFWRKKNADSGCFTAVPVNKIADFFIKKKYKKF
jgi:hypothetical protein